MASPIGGVGDLMAIEFDGFSQPVLERDPRAIAEYPSCIRDIGAAVLEVARPRFGMRPAELPTDDSPQPIDDVEQRERAVLPDVEDLSCALEAFGGEQVRIDNVIDISKIARLK